MSFPSVRHIVCEHCGLTSPPFPTMPSLDGTWKLPATKRQGNHFIVEEITAQSSDELVDKIERDRQRGTCISRVSFDDLTLVPPMTCPRCGALIHTARHGFPGADRSDDLVEHVVTATDILADIQQSVSRQDYVTIKGTHVASTIQDAHIHVRFDGDNEENLISDLEAFSQELVLHGYIHKLNKSKRFAVVAIESKGRR